MQGVERIPGFARQVQGDSIKPSMFNLLTTNGSRHVIGRDIDISSGICWSFSKYDQLTLHVHCFGGKPAPSCTYLHMPHTCLQGSTASPALDTVVALPALPQHAALDSQGCLQMTQIGDTRAAAGVSAGRLATDLNKCSRSLLLCQSPRQPANQLSQQYRVPLSLVDIILPTRGSAQRTVSESDRFAI